MASSMISMATILLLGAVSVANSCAVDPVASSLLYTKGQVRKSVQNVKPIQNSQTLVQNVFKPVPQVVHAQQDV